MKTALITCGAVLAATALAAQAPPTSVTTIPGAEVSAAFAKGRPLLENSAYKVHASRRDAPGEAELHGLDTDIFHVLEGSATLVTGGRITEAKETAANERRGAAITGGTSQRLTKGDIVIVPKGVPHQFTETSSPFLYYTVKVTQP
jgi:mannose-6-phosphate isomerase-like protein (cupin superfamily)